MGAYSDPSPRVETVTPHNTNDIPLTRGLYIGTSGALKFNDESGNAVTFATAVAGYHPLRVTRVYDTGTDATDIHALY